MGSVKSIEEATRANLKKSLSGKRPLICANNWGVSPLKISMVITCNKLYFAELGLGNGQRIHVADSTTPNSLLFILQLASNMEKDWFLLLVSIPSPPALGNKNVCILILQKDNSFASKLCIVIW